MKYFLDCEFIEDGKTIDLISIGLVSADGREFYAVNRECNFQNASDWVWRNVLYPIGIYEPLQYISLSDPSISPLTKATILAAKNRRQIKTSLLEFLAFQDISKPPEEIYKQCNFWGEWCSYDWVCFCQIFGTMMDLPQVHLVYYRDPQEGDLVIGMTTGEIGYLERVSKDESGNNVYLINVLGTDEVVEWQEEIFRPILGSSASRKDSVSGNDYTDIL